MELTIAHLYPDAMSLYGEYANVSVLRRHLDALGVETTLRAITFEDEMDVSGADFIYMGAGTETRQKAVLNAAASLGARLKAAVEDGAVLLFTGNAMETLGASVTDAAGKVWPGYGLAEFTTVETDRRDPGDVVAESSLWDAAPGGVLDKGWFLFTSGAAGGKRGGYVWGVGGCIQKEQKI